MLGLIEHVAKALVEDPSQVSVNEVVEGRDTVLELKVAPKDVGKVIGKQGRTVRAMRNLLSGAALRSGKYYDLEILED
ncbi:MAG: KH domain-containing protein [Acidobacteriota bacterium]|nr:KH domain-containing protein [Acidobacteriota bacterium]